MKLISYCYNSTKAASRGKDILKQAINADSTGWIFIIVMMFALWAGLLSGCAAPASGPIVSVRYSSTLNEKLWLPPDDDIEPRLASARKILTGFDNLQLNTGLSMNNRLLLAVELDHNGAHDLWFVGIRVNDEGAAPAEPDDNDHRISYKNNPSRPDVSPPPATQLNQLVGTIRSDDGTLIDIESKLLRVEVSVYDQSAELLQSSSLLIPPDFFSIGPYESCKIYDDLNRHAPAFLQGDMASALHALPVDKRRAFLSSAGAGALSMSIFVRALQENEALVQLRSSAWLEIARVPSLLDIISHFGLRINVEPDFIRSRSALYRWPGRKQLLDAFEFPTVVRANQHEALRCRIVAVKPIGLLRIIAGMVYFEAVHPDKPENRVTIRLLAARLASTEL